MTNTQYQQNLLNEMLFYIDDNIEDMTGIEVSLMVREIIRIEGEIEED